MKMLSANNKYDEEKDPISHSSIIQNRYLLFMILGIILVVSVSFIVWITDNKAIAQSVEVATLEVARISENADFTSVSVKDLNSSTIFKSGLMTSLSVADESFDPNTYDIHSIKMMLGNNAASTILRNIPFEYHDSKTNSQSDIYRAVIKANNKYYGIVLTVPASAGLVSNIIIPEYSDLAKISIQRESGDLHNPLIPTQHLVTNYLKANNSTITRLIDSVDRHYDPTSSDNFPLRFNLDKTDALHVLKIIPFKYNETETSQSYDLYSTMIEEDGKFYTIILWIPK